LIKDQWSLIRRVIIYIKSLKMFDLWLELDNYIINIGIIKK
jgi:hypothetical protein